MNLVSQNFILFMIITTLLYYISPKKVKKYTLLVISFGVLLCLGFENVVYILFSTIISYCAALGLEKGKYKKVIFIGTIGINTFILFGMKVIPYLNELKNFEKINLLVPIGISYFTFQSISYLADVYQKKYKPEKNFFSFALYMMYLPYLFVGPINRFNKVKESLIEEQDKKINAESLYKGILRICIGFFKKLVIASRIQIIIATITADTNTYIGAYSLLAMLLYSIELYADFSGGIDIVLGFSKILQIQLTENFNLPYLATSISDFWRRWHISLSSWFRDYVYIPLGGNRKGKLRQYINIMIVFILSGIWHGANYLLWGILHGVFSIIDKMIHTDNMKKWISIPCTFLIVSILWSFFIWPDTITSLKMIGSIFTTFNYQQMVQNIFNLGINLPNMIVLIIAVAGLVLASIKKEKWDKQLEKSNGYIKLSILLIFIIIILIFGIYGIGFNVSEFIYNKF